MSFSINNLMESVDDAMMEEDMIYNLFDHRHYFNNDKASIFKTIDKHMAYKNQGCFLSTLKEIKLEATYHIPTLIVNGLGHPNYQTRDLTEFYIPDNPTLTQMLNTYKTRKSKKIF